MNGQSDFDNGSVNFQDPVPPQTEAGAMPPPPSYTPPVVDSKGGDITPDDRLWAALAYVLSPLGSVVIYLMEDKKGRPFIKEHNVQALILGLINVALAVALGWLCCGIGNLVLWGVCCYFGYQAYQGKSVEIPVLSQLVRDQGWNK
jgi:uncharacterized membrane protein